MTSSEEAVRLIQTTTQDLRLAFSPGSVAVIGASGSQPWGPGKRYVQALVESGYKGTIYPLNTSGNDVMGLKAYTSILDLPGKVDLAICCIPAPLTPQLMKDCAARGVGVVCFFTAGFSETGTEQGRKLEQEILNIARSGGIRILGPNCMGMLSTDSGISFFGCTVPGKGPLSFVSQSGGYAQEIVGRGHARGLGISKVVSYGNAADLDEADFLSYLARDEASEIVAVYIEGSRDGLKLIHALREVTQRKPLILLKGGRTLAGTRAARSHTDSLAGNVDTWQALYRQTGAMPVSNLDEIIDLALTFAFLPPARGRRVGVLTFGGGRSVLSSDECEAAGLIVPQLPDEVMGKLREFTPAAGTAVRNPVDSARVVALNLEYLARTIELIATSGVIDLLIVYLYAEFIYPDVPHLLEQHVETAAGVSRNLGKPMAVVLSTTGEQRTANMVFEAQELCTRAGVPMYPTVGRAAEALSRFAAYHEGRDAQAGSNARSKRLDNRS